MPVDLLPENKCFGSRVSMTFSLLLYELLCSCFICTLAILIAFFLLGESLKPSPVITSLVVLTSTLMDQVQEMIVVSLSIRCKLFIIIEFSLYSWSALSRALLNSMLLVGSSRWIFSLLHFLYWQCFFSFSPLPRSSTRNFGIRSLIRVSTVHLKLTLTCNYSYNYGFIFNSHFQSHIHILNEFLNARLICRWKNYRRWSQWGTLFWLML